MAEAFGPDEFLCPRREENPFIRPGGVDKWMMRDGYRHCSYCGSLHHEHLFEAIEAGAKVTPTDKNYKIYVDVPDPRAGELKVTGMTNSEPTYRQDEWVKVTEENLPELIADGWGDNNLGSWMMKTPRGSTIHDKFYFQHLSGAEQDKFIDLLNGKKINLAYPGHFYVLPYFAVPVEKTGSAA
jgi:hypothetical protein